jgi:transposase
MSDFESFGPGETRGAEDMARVTNAVPHLSLAEVKHRMTTDQSAMVRQRWLIIYNALVEPRKAEEIARHCGVSKATVHALISRYNRAGVEAIETPGKGGRRRQYLTLEEEQKFLAPFFAQAECGEIATVGQIWQAFEQRVRHAVDDSTIYRLLHRHGWRKVMPRPRHKKSDLNTQEQFKKTFLPRWKRQSQRKRRVMNGPSSFWPRMKAAMPRISQVKHCWAPPGMRPNVPAQSCKSIKQVGITPKSWSSDQHPFDPATSLQP